MTERMAPFPNKNLARADSVQEEKGEAGNRVLLSWHFIRKSDITGYHRATEAYFFPSNVSKQENLLFQIFKVHVNFSL